MKLIHITYLRQLSKNYSRHFFLESKQDARKIIDKSKQTKTSCTIISLKLDSVAPFRSPVNKLTSFSNCHFLIEFCFVFLKVFTYNLSILKQTKKTFHNLLTIRQFFYSRLRNPSKKR